MRVSGSEIPETSAVADDSKRASFDLSLQIPELGQSADTKVANPSGLEWQTQISVALYTAKAAPRAGAVRVGRNDPPVSATPVPVAAFNQDTLKNVAAFGKCLAPSQDGSCGGWISLGNGFIFRYASSRVLAHTPDFKDRVTQVAALLGLSNHLMALPGVTKTPGSQRPDVEVASLPRGSRWQHEH